MAFWASILKIPKREIKNGTSGVKKASSNSILEIIGQKMINERRAKTKIQMRLIRSIRLTAGAATCVPFLNQNFERLGTCWGSINN